MSIGERREQIVIQSATASVDSEGYPAKTWATYTTIWARAESLNGRELEAMQKVNSEISMRFTVNYRADITEQHRVSWRSKYWNIHAVLPGESKFEMALLASRVE